MPASPRGCPQLSWTGRSKTPIPKRSKALTELCVAPCLVMSPSLGTLLVGHTVQLTRSSNHGPGRSVRALCAGVGAPIPSGGQVEQTLQKIQKDYESNKEYQKSQAYKTKQIVKRKKLYKLYEEHQEEVMYQQKIMLLESRARGKREKQPEHNYSKSSD